MADRFVVLPLASVTGLEYGSLGEAEQHAGKKTDADGRPHVIVQVIGEVRRRTAPNVEVVRFGGQEVAHVG